MSQSHVRGWRLAFLGAGLLAALGVAGYAVGFLFAISSFNPSISFVPDQVGTGTNWPALAQSLCLVVFAVPLTPVAVLFSMRRLASHPYAAVIALSLVVLTLVFEVGENVPSIAVQLYPGTLASVPSTTTLYSTQVESIRLLVAQIAGLVSALVAVLVYGLVARDERPIIFRLVIASLAVFAISAGLLPLSPAASLLLVAGAILALAPVPVLIAWLAVETMATDSLTAKGRRPNPS